MNDWSVIASGLLNLIENTENALGITLGENAAFDAAWENVKLALDEAYVAAEESQQ